MKAFSQFLSGLFHPLLMPSYLFGVLMLLSPTWLSPIREEIMADFVLLVFLVTFVVPVIMLITLRLFGTLPSLTMETRTERLMPFLMILLVYVAMTWLFYGHFGLAWRENLMKFLVIADLLMIASVAVTFVYKISIHAVGLCGLLGMLLPLNKMTDDGLLLYPTIALIFIAGIVMSARLYLQVHSPREVMTGAVMGYSVSSIAMLILFR